MRIIDLLNKIANEEDVPKYIKVYNDIFEYNDFNKLYWNSKDKQLLDIYNGRILNYEAEILEEEKKIPEKLKTLNANYYSKEVYYENYSKEEISLDIETLQIWVNKIIDYLELGEL